jgi:hypothetical protein
MRRKKRKQPSARRLRPLAGNREYLKAAPRALVEREDEPRRLRREPAEDASVEDPLRDWPED